MKNRVKIKELGVWDMPDKKSIHDGYYLKDIPEATPENMIVMMNKINDLIKVVNELTTPKNSYEKQS